MNIEQAIVSCGLRCEAEAVAMGFPAEMGRDIYCGCVDDDLNNWTKEEYLAWSHSIDAKYSCQWSDWKPLYKKVNDIMGEFGKMLGEDCGGQD
jgi:hypothetical protein